LQTDVRNINILLQTVSFLSYNQDEINNKINFIISELQNKKNIVNNELSVSNNFLNAAKVNEMQKQIILSQKKIELTRAIQQEVAALTSGNPAAISMATSLVAIATQEEMIANREFQNSTQNRISMEMRVEIVSRAKYNIEQLYERSKIEFNSQLSIIKNFTEISKNRLTNSDLDLKKYLNMGLITTIPGKFSDMIDNGLLNAEKYFKTLGITDLEKSLLNDARIERSNGKIVAKRNNTFDPTYKDALGRTNKERMEDGLAPIGIDDKSLELHHLKQKDNGVMIELTNKEHNQNSKVLHKYRTQSEIDRREFNNWKRKYWKERAKEFECKF
jgi:hypothetical protein